MRRTFRRRNEGPSGGGNSQNNCSKHYCDGENHSDIKQRVLNNRDSRCSNESKPRRPIIWPQLRLRLVRSFFDHDDNNRIMTIFVCINKKHDNNNTTTTTAVTKNGHGGDRRQRHARGPTGLSPCRRHTLVSQHDQEIGGKEKFFCSGSKQRQRVRSSSRSSWCSWW